MINHPVEFKEAFGCGAWSYRLNWLEAQNATITNLTFADGTQFFGFIHLVHQMHEPHRVAGMKQAQVLEGPDADLPLLFAEKRVILVTIRDVYMDGAEAVPYTACEVYATSNFNTPVCVSVALAVSAFLLFLNAPLWC